MSRPAWAELDLAALKHNLGRVRQHAPASKVMCVIKANGYGHGLTRVANALSDADALGVASIDEAIRLREAGVTQRIVLLEGVFDSSEVVLAAQHKLDLVIHNQRQIDFIRNAELNQALLSVWLKIDTGMHRLGFSTGEAAGIFEALNKLDQIQLPVILMTHLANADELKNVFTATQLEKFNSVTDNVSSASAVERSMANSAGILGWPESHGDWVRPGVMLYGISPFADKTGADFDLQPVMSVKSRLIELRAVNKGEPVGYGGLYQCEKDMLIGVVAFGYGDGYPRHAKNGTKLLVNGKKASLIGRVSMDMIMVDLSGHDGVKIGDEVELWGKNLPVELLASSSDTIAYELVCGVTQRVNYVEV